MYFERCFQNFLHIQIITLTDTEAFDIAIIFKMIRFIILSDICSFLCQFNALRLAFFIRIVKQV